MKKNLSNLSMNRIYILVCDLRCLQFHWIQSFFVNNKINIREAYIFFLFLVFIGKLGLNSYGFFVRNYQLFDPLTIGHFINCKIKLNKLWTIDPRPPPALVAIVKSENWSSYHGLASFFYFISCLLLSQLGQYPKTCV